MAQIIPFQQAKNNKSTAPSLEGLPGLMKPGEGMFSNLNYAGGELSVQDKNRRSSLHLMIVNFCNSRNIEISHEYAGDLANQIFNSSFGKGSGD